MGARIRLEAVSKRAALSWNTRLCDAIDSIHRWIALHFDAVPVHRDWCFEEVVVDRNPDELVLKSLHQRSWVCVVHQQGSLLLVIWNIKRSFPRGLAAKIYCRSQVIYNPITDIPSIGFVALREVKCRGASQTCKGNTASQKGRTPTENIS